MKTFLIGITAIVIIFTPIIILLYVIHLLTSDFIKIKPTYWIILTILIFMLTSPITGKLFIIGASYSTLDGEFQDSECLFKGRTIDSIESLFEQHRIDKKNQSLKLYRTRKRIWSNPLIWWDNLTHKRWKYPYRDIKRRDPNKPDQLRDGQTRN